MGCNQSVGVPSSDVPLVGPHAEFQKASFSYTGRPFVIFVLGGPGSGKGTQCSLIARDYGFVHLSTGDLLRKEENNPDSPNAEFIKNRLKEGKMVPVEISVNLLLKEMQQNVREGRSLFLIDGFPRNQDNVDGWNRVVGDYAEVAFALFFDCAEQVMLERLKKRGETSGRSDDGLEVIVKRFRTFQQDSMPIVDQFDAQGKLRKVSAMDSKEVVYEVVRKVLDTEISLWKAKLEAEEAKRKNEKPVIAVVTGNSNTGFATVRSLSAIASAAKSEKDQFTIRAVVRSEDKAARLRGLPNVDVMVDPLDITKPTELKRVFAGVNKALITAPSTAENRVEIAKGLIDAARRGGVSHVVLISVLGAANQSILFQKQFRAMELHLCASGMRWTYLRCGAFADLFVSTRDSIVKRGEFYGCSGEGKFAAIPTEEVGRCAAVVLSNQTGSHENKIYDLTGPAAYSQGEYAELMSKVMSYEIKYIDLPREAVEKSLTVGAGWAEWRAQGLTELLDTIKLGNAAMTSNDVRKLLGKQMSFEQWVSANAIQWDRRDVAAVLTGNSNTGFATVRALLTPPFSQKVRVRAAVRHETKAKVLRDLRQAMEVVAGVDAAQPSSLQAVFEGAKVAFITVPNYDANRVQLTKNMIDSAVQHGVQHITIVSLIGGTEETSLGKQFREIEHHLASAGVSYSVLRLAAFAENFIGSKDTIVKEGYFFGATGEGKYAAVSLDDVGRCAAVTLTEPEKRSKKVFELTGPKALSGAEYAQIFSSVLGYNVMYRDEPRDVIVKFMIESGWPRWQAEGMGELMGHMSEQKHGWVSPDVQLLTGQHTEFESFLTGVASIFSRKGVAIVKPVVAVVTGNSNTGYATLRALVNEYSNRVKIRAVVRSADKVARIRALGVEVVTGVDANQVNSFKQAFDGVSSVFIVTPNFVENRAELAKNMVDAAKKFGVRHVVVMSVCDANLQRSVFEKQFYSVEQHAVSSGLGYTFLRCAYFMDNWLGSRDAIVQHKAIYGCHGDGKFAAVAVDDIGRAAAACLAFPDRHKNRSYSITGPKTLNGAEYAAVFGKLLGHSVQYIDQPGEQFRAALVSFGFPEWQSAALVQMFDQIRTGQMQYSVSDDVKRVTGRQTSFEDWVEANAAFFGKPGAATPAPVPANTSDEPVQNGVRAAAETKQKEGVDEDADKPVETTYAMIKPDVVAANRDEELIEKIKSLGFHIVAKKNLNMSDELAEEFYAEHKGRKFFPDLVGFMTSGPCVAMALRKTNAIKAWRDALGPTNTAKAKETAPNSIRALFGTDQQANAAHGSDSAASAKRELGLIFPDLLV